MKKIINNNNIVSKLGAEERIIIWSIREWKICILTAKDPIKNLVCGLTQASIQKISFLLDDLLKRICTYSLKPIDIRCHCSEYLGETESELLLAISFFQNKNLNEHLNTKKKINNRNDINYKIEHIANLLFDEQFFLKNNQNLSNKNYNNEKNIIYYDFSKNNTLH